MISLNQAIRFASSNRMSSEFPLTELQYAQLAKLNAFAIHQAVNNEEVRRMPAKMIYKVNSELKLALVVLLSTCAMMDYHRQGREDAKFFNEQVKIIQDENGDKYFSFGVIREELLERFLIPEIVDDWITFRDVNGDGMSALFRKKLGFEDLSGYTGGGDIIYQFVRFYRKLMERKQIKSDQVMADFQRAATQRLANRVVDQKLLSGQSAEEILKNLMEGRLLDNTADDVWELERDDDLYLENK